MARDFLLTQGLGVVIEPGNGQPQWVLSYGDIAQLALLNSLEPQPISAQSSGREQLSAAEQVLVGQPSETLLPLVTRNVLRNYFSQHGVPDIQLCLMSRMTPSGPDQSIVFDATPERFQSEEHYQGVMQSLAWFLPRHYRYSAMARSSLANGFLPL
jgi:hypothetical protein